MDSTLLVMDWPYAPWIGPYALAIPAYATLRVIKAWIFDKKLSRWCCPYIQFHTWAKFAQENLNFAWCENNICVSFNFPISIGNLFRFISRSCRRAASRRSEHFIEKWASWLDTCLEKLHELWKMDHSFRFIFDSLSPCFSVSLSLCLPVSFKFISISYPVLFYCCSFWVHLVCDLLFSLRFVFLSGSLG